MIIFDPIERALWIIAISLMIFCSYLFFTRARKSQLPDEKRIMYGFTFFVFCFSICRLIFYISDFYIVGNYINHTYHGDLSSTTLIYDHLTILGHMAWMIGMTIFFFSFERTESFTKYLFTISSIIVIIVTAIAIEFRYLSIAFFGIILIGVLIYLSIKSSKEIKDVSAFIFIGIFFVAIGSMFTTMTIRALINLIFPGLAPLLFIIGTTIVIAPHFLEQKYLSRAIPIWIILIFFLLIYIIISPVIVFRGDFHLYVTILILSINIPAIIVLLFSVNHIWKIIKSKSNSYEFNEEEQRDEDFLKLFSKPKKVTEEEITISKEKKTCLVCKNELSRENYICPECKAFYCVKCASALASLENACWVCNVPFDESKPSFLPESSKVIKEVDNKKQNHKKS
ncbi:MAG: hypothetical protein ACFFAO_16515 [Candidatus Hermodarchaeota archaeon]